ncbi:MAG: transcription elongation factor GreA [Bacteroidia bacterium]|jgi:transcription elongation factor GreA|nr:transcription elongation factor GreA [Sphingobacteriaceae bacterium]MBK7310314.1 transcription elongation factor GreA [Sphingobacteriaceae bacterium]MBK7816284.1 transcription elongation factor GreA [Sphingobacteriaceae bacterium]MBP9069784.1 transcription elongation factor GreA [Bacteroidia bacterium]
MAQQLGYYTEEGLQKLKDELHNLESVERKAATNAVAEARDKGDLSENAEYDAAREAQALLELKIGKLKEVIANARIVDETKLDLSKASILTTVKIKNTKNNATMKYTLVAESEADLKSGKISVDSPIGKALLGKKVKDKVDVTVPAGLVTFEIIEISL